jgi:hypothetical protein
MTAWGERLTAAVVAEVRRRRNEWGWHAKDLSEQVTEHGGHLPRTVIAKLEAGDRKQLTVAELLILAAALRCPPTLLLAPILNRGREDASWEIELTPGQPLAPERALAQLTEAPVSSPDWAALDVLRNHQAMVSELVNGDRQVSHRRKKGSRWPEEVEHLEAKLNERCAVLRGHRGTMKDRGVYLPELPAVVAEHLDDPSLPWGIPDEGDPDAS